jgi:E3 ubiquitin-protein ligase SHPRH
VGDILSLPDGEKALVFSEWEEMLSIVESALKANEVVCGRIRGNRDFCTLLPRFREGVDGMRVLLLPLKKGAEGLNLVEATHIFLLEPVLNAAAEAQAINRCKLSACACIQCQQCCLPPLTNLYYFRVHRIGQTRPTTVHRLLVVDTIEEGIRDLQAKRAVAAGGADALLLTDAAVAKRSSGYTRDDIVTLFDDDEVRTEEKEASE